LLGSRLLGSSLLRGRLLRRRLLGNSLLGRRLARRCLLGSSLLGGSSLGGHGLPHFFFPGFSADLSVELEVNFIAVDAAIWTSSPVCGLRPVRAERSVVLNEPKPGHWILSPPFVALTTVS